MATTSSKLLFRWVQGQQGRNPVRVFSLRTDGNVVLADAGRIAWQSNSADKGAVAGRVRLPCNSNVQSNNKRNSVMFKVESKLYWI
ncbi:hypothetical protein V6N13_129105 [Hibiscus sabdariffa]|uniref:Bulb-type lectin domain-containing protein n=1 Tax=Hibiscus sabdariffa TaxID=183260 RepID=A0ABR2SK57_9ROSI